MILLSTDDDKLEKTINIENIAHRKLKKKNTQKNTVIGNSNLTIRNTCPRTLWFDQMLRTNSRAPLVDSRQPRVDATGDNL